MNQLFFLYVIACIIFTVVMVMITNKIFKKFQKKFYQDTLELEEEYKNSQLTSSKMSSVEWLQKKQKINRQEFKFKILYITGIIIVYFPVSLFAFFSFQKIFLIK